jgi:hypothetical protein
MQLQMHTIYMRFSFGETSSLSILWRSLHLEWRNIQEKNEHLLLLPVATKSSIQNSMSLFRILSWSFDMWSTFRCWKEKLKSVNRTSLVSSIDQVQEAFQSLSNTITYVIRIDEETLPHTPDGLQKSYHLYSFKRKINPVSFSIQCNKFVVNKWLKNQ